MPLDLLPTRTDSAAANMASDFLLLQHYPDPTRVRCRFYGWRRPAITFGYGQKFAEVREQLGEEADMLELCRRPSGGGIVDHRDDWTYALVIPAQHDLGAARASESYRAVHHVLADVLQAQGCPARLQTTEPNRPELKTKGAAVCFTKAEPADVIHARSQAKIAGAAQKRSKRGLLFQGSISRRATGELDWERFGADFVAGLDALLQTTATPAPWPEMWDDAVDALAEDYASDAWNARR